MKKIVSLLMCLILIASCATLLFSCKKDDDGPDGGQTQGIDLTGYSVIAGAELTDLGYKHALSFTKDLSKLTSLELALFEDKSTAEVASDDREILIGMTSRVESTETYNEIEGDGWAVRVFENKIAIVGTTPYLTRAALTWFTQTHLNAEHISGTTLKAQEKNVVSDLPTLSLGEISTYTVVYETGKDENDAPFQVMTSLCTDFEQKTNATLPTATADREAVAKEILVGNMTRADVKAEMAKIDADECAVTVRDGKIYLVSWSDNLLPAAYELFEEMLECSSATDANGNVTYRIPSDCSVAQVCDTDWFTDFPKPVAHELFPEAAVDVNDGSLQYIYSGNGASRATFVMYCETLKEAGYAPMGNEDVQWEGSSFRTFVNNEKGVSLHVSHMAFAHAEEQGVDLFKNSIRIVSGYTEWGGTLVDEQYFRPQIAGTEAQVKSGQADYVKRMNSQITANAIDYRADGNWGLGQILTLADGSFIIIDGGKNKTSEDTFTLWSVMTEMYKKAHNGKTPSKEEPIHIRAWIVTHEHGDHHDLVRYFCNEYGNRIDLRFDYMMVNFGSMTQLRIGRGNENLRNGLKGYQNAVKNGFEYIQVNSGQVFYFANCRLEILATIDDWAVGYKTGDQNETSTIFRTALIEYDDQGTPHETTSMWTGDARYHLSKAARAMYGSFLKSDQVQISHHGLYGVEGKFYDLVNAEVIWLPDSVNQGVADRFYYRLDNVDTHWAVSAAFLNPNSKYLIFNGTDRTYPFYSVTVTITAAGPLYDQMYDPITETVIEAKNELWPVIDVPAYRAAKGM